MERVRGIEPLSIAWKAMVIAIIRHPRVWLVRTGVIYSSVGLFSSNF